MQARVDAISGTERDSFPASMCIVAPLPQKTLTLRQASSAVDKADLGLLCGRLVAVNSASPLTEADGNQ